MSTSDTSAVLPLSVRLAEIAAQAEYLRVIASAVEDAPPSYQRAASLNFLRDMMHATVRLSLPEPLSFDERMAKLRADLRALDTVRP